MTPYVSVAMITAPMTVQGLTVIGPNDFRLHLDPTKLAFEMVAHLPRLEVEKLRALCAEALASTQDGVTQPELLGRVVPR